MKTASNPINADMTVNEAVQQCPTSLAVFQKFGIDSCCGGPLPIKVAATKHGHDVNEVMAALRSTSDCKATHA